MDISRSRSPVITTDFLNGQAFVAADSHPYLGVVLE